MTFDSVLVRLRDQIPALRDTLKSTKIEGGILGGPLVEWVMSCGSEDWLTVFVTKKMDLSLDSLVICTLLCMQRAFKLLLLKAVWKDVFVSVFVGQIPEDVDCCIWYKNCLFALFKSENDRPRIVSPHFESAGLTFADQLRFEKTAASQINPGTPEEWTMTSDEANAILSLFVHKDAPTLSKNLVKLKAGNCLACFCRVVEYRPLVIRSHGVDVLLAAGDVGAHVALARLCMTTSPQVWNYSQSVSMGKVCFELIKNSTYDLFKFEAAIGLINLLSFHEEVRDWVAKLPDGWETCFDLLSSEDTRLQTSGTELICNLCLSPIIVEKIAEGNFAESLKILLLLSDEFVSAGGALAILAAQPCLVAIFEEFVSDLLAKLNNTQNEDHLLRIVACLVSIHTQTKKLQLRNQIEKNLSNVKHQNPQLSQMLAPFSQKTYT